MPDIVKTVMTLTGIACLAAVIATAFYLQVADQIDDPVEIRYQEALRHSMPAVAVIHEREGAEPLPPRYWVAECGKIVAAYAFPVEAIGFSGPIQAIVSVDTIGTILGITIISHMETPGLGGRITEKIHAPWWGKKNQPDQAYEPWFTRQFKDLSIQSSISIADSSDEWPKLSNEARRQMAGANRITAISGATQSTARFVRAVSDEIKMYLNILHRKA